MENAYHENQSQAFRKIVFLFRVAYIAYIK